ncbi:hypothetical protein BV25DRAFT_1823310 [Artomyces pyxidatus]|uniref:Uncharacterized protein n=1 Tax=Artomyces pyxidatus TaxID=48021 RepID=A0ACB8T8J1_9AGAM|nr:hypothetical protein BV25DRAFT_1823310 [Artomyces pyxidatus]
MSSEPPTDRGPSRKRRKSKGLAQNSSHGDSGSDAVSTVACLDKMPVEILSEILFYVPSPKEVLAVTRCNKHLCATLLNPSNISIWRRAREECTVGALPPPFDGWSESAYAAFVFDGGNCEVCGKNTPNMYQSFSLRLRICRNSECRKAFRSLLYVNPPHSAATQFITTWIPQLEPNQWRKFWHQPVVICLKKQYHQAVDEFNKFVQLRQPLEEYHRRHEVDVRRLDPTLATSVSLLQWRALWETRYNEVKKANIAFTQQIAAHEGWSAGDMFDTPTYGSLHRSHTACLQKVSQSSFDLIRPRVEAEIITISETRKRRVAEHSHQVRREDIGRHHQRLCSAPEPTVVPPLPEFRKLPVLKVLQSKDSMGIEDELKNSLTLRDLVQTDLQRWTAAARRDLGRVLGYPEWKNPSTKVLHPVDRVTARLKCQRCSRVARKYADVGSLDFVGACAHECPGLAKKTSARRVWAAGQFIPDQKAIDVISQAATLAAVKPEDQGAREALESLGAHFLCKSCDAPIVMDFRRLMGHAERHDRMEISLLSEVEAAATLTQPFIANSYLELMDRTHEASKTRKTPTFVCRHCSHGSALGGPSREEKSVGRPKMMSFDGLVSHVKAKHGIAQMSDEDFFRDLNAALSTEIPERLRVV